MKRTIIPELLIPTSTVRKNQIIIACLSIAIGMVISVVTAWVMHTRAIKTALKAEQPFSASLYVARTGTIVSAHKSSLSWRLGIEYNRSIITWDIPIAETVIQDEPHKTPIRDFGLGNHDYKIGDTITEVWCEIESPRPEIHGKLILRFWQKELK